MTWTVKVTLREGREDVGIVSCIKNAGQGNEYVHPAIPVKLTPGAIDKFVAKVKAEHEKTEPRVTKESEAAGTIATALNKKAKG